MLFQSNLIEAFYLRSAQNFFSVKNGTEPPFTTFTIMAYKRRTKKTGSTTRTTTTQRSGKGTRITHSTKSGSGGITRTRSTSWNKDGSLRQTTTDNNNGWITRRTKTFGSKRKSSSGGGRGRRKHSSIDTGFGGIFVGILLVIVGVVALSIGGLVPLLIVAGVVFALWLVILFLPYLIGLAFVVGVVYLYLK